MAELVEKVKKFQSITTERWNFRRKKMEFIGPSLPLTEVVADSRLVEALTLVEKLGDVIVSVLQQAAVDQEADPLRERRSEHRAQSEHQAH